MGKFEKGRAEHGDVNRCDGMESITSSASRCVCGGGVGYQQHVEVVLRQAGQCAAAYLLVQYFGTVRKVAARRASDFACKEQQREKSFDGRAWRGGTHSRPRVLTSEQTWGGVTARMCLLRRRGSGTHLLVIQTVKIWREELLPGCMQHFVADKTEQGGRIAFAGLRSRRTKENRNRLTLCVMMLRFIVYMQDSGIDYCKRFLFSDRVGRFVCRCGAFASKKRKNTNCLGKT